MYQAAIEQLCSIALAVSKTRCVIWGMLSCEIYFQEQASQEGTHFLIPWLQRAILYDCRIKPRVSARILFTKFANLSPFAEYIHHDRI